MDIDIMNKVLPEKEIVVFTKERSQELFDFMKNESHNPAATPFIKKFLSDARTVFFMNLIVEVTIIGGKITAFMAYAQQRDYLYRYFVYVGFSHRRQGLATQMLERTLLLAEGKRWFNLVSSKENAILFAKFGIKYCGITKQGHAVVDLFIPKKDVEPDTKLLVAKKAMRKLECNEWDLTSTSFEDFIKTF